MIKIEKLIKKYGKQTVVNIDSLQVKEGEIYGFLGPNGAGKSTTMKMILSLVTPTNGRIQIMDREMNDDTRVDLLQQIGSLIEGPSYYSHLTGMDNMKIIQALKNVPKKNIEKAIQIVGLENHMNKKVKNYSLGMKQRLGVAMAISSFPKLLILDEPTNGLDPAGMEEMRELIKTLPKEYGITIMISSHILDEVEKMVTSIGIINKGHMIFEGSLDEFKRNSHPSICFKTSNPQKTFRLLQEKNPEFKEEGILLTDLSDGEIAYCAKKIIDGGLDLYRMEEKTKSLEKLFIQLTGKKNL
ncbi:MAG TPA: ATP-binding cassette domain-containing protein [Tissierellia bacterium]|nr:ATP-binding cassette domain-containing protein [Tissierellia bacterium]